VETEAGHNRNGQTEIYFNNYESAGVGHIELGQSPAKTAEFEGGFQRCRNVSDPGFSELANQIKPTIFNLQV
jgi:hypothetical protein